MKSASATKWLMKETKEEENCKNKYLWESVEFEIEGKVNFSPDNIFK